MTSRGVHATVHATLKTVIQQKSLEELKFDNSLIRELPGDQELVNSTRQVIEK